MPPPPELWTAQRRNIVSSFAVGVLNARQVKKLIDEGVITDCRAKPDASSLDLTVREGVAWELIRGVVKPEADTSHVTTLEDSHLAKRVSFEESGIVIPAKKSFVFQMNERLLLDQPLYAHATGKSSIGRLDVLARLIADGQAKYDQIDPPFNGQLYVEVTPLTFPILVRPNDSICQLRIFKGHPSRSRLRGTDLDLYCRAILNFNDPAELRVTVAPANVPEEQQAAAFKAKVTGSPIEIGAPQDYVDPEDYWELISPKDGGIQIVGGAFYIFRSVERFRLPQDIAVYAEAMHESLGEMRIHYAGFVHPHFGASRLDGTPLIFEVRGHDVDVFLKENEVLAKLQYFKLSEAAEPPEEQSYEKQELKLSKQFRPWGTER